MPDFLIRPYEDKDFPAVQRIWNEAVDAGEVLYYPLTDTYFRKKFLLGDGCEPENLLIAEADGQVCAFLHGVAPGTFALSRPGKSYLTCVMTARDARRKGMGTALLARFKENMRRRGAETLGVSSLNPVQLDWRIPGTPGHDHNNMPGADLECAGYGFLTRSGFVPGHEEMAMYRPLRDYALPYAIRDLQARLAREGVYTGPYDASWNCDFETMCKNVGSDYWRDVLQTEIDAWKRGAPNADARMWADGIQPNGPRTLLTAVHENRIVGFTGPVDLQKSGRGWFTGICTDPGYEGRGIGTVLFHLLMDAFTKENAQFTTLFTGTDNHAQKIYRGAGLSPVRSFVQMSMSL